ncbi:hypothetical protein [Paenibacillus glycanilyticus]|uniref:Uncharacterized protein n=1 Tax=Paenibacillus glycanilyticus TaxID=126569 RepID=A0ABQ6GLX5_9BACL|nr:hypothetical protein [Paenibacillus glycanilyticus]GLX71240.1 hypothetical protein MU1_55890 [Paenibacillus glycanilyticus]
MIKLRHMSLESKYSVLSLASVSGVLLLHIVHWSAMPLLMGAASQMHAHHHEMGDNPSFLISTLMMVLFIVNLISMYFAGRQLIAAVMRKGSHTGHSVLCTGLSIGVLCIGFYTMASF